MKFARGLAVVSLISASLPLAVACGSASNDLFSASGGSLSAAGAGTSLAGSNSEGGSGNAGTVGGETGIAGDKTGGGAGSKSNGGSSGSSVGGVSGGSAEGGSPAAGASAAGSDSTGAGSGGASAGSGGSIGGTAGVSAGGNGGASAGTGGAGPNAGCPTSAVPKDGAVCTTTTPDSCFYSGVACSCLPTNGGGGPGSLTKKWACYGTPNSCPDTKPVAATSCKFNLGAECPYPGGDFCACVGFNNEAKWACQPDVPVCSGKPVENAPCATARTCSYSDVACFCNGANWSCEGG